MQLAHIKTALSQGCKLHAFLSGGGLRVVRIVNAKDELKGYGEHPHIEDALAHANTDVSAGGRPYNEVYRKEFPLYLTGSTNPTSPLDAWVRKGGTFDVKKDGDEYVFDLVGYQHFELPDQIKQRLDGGEDHIEWDDERGFRYHAQHSQFPNGEPTVSTSVVSKPTNAKNSNAFIWRATKTGRATGFWDALELAWDASPVELKKD